MMASLGEELRRWRIRHGLTQTDLALRLGCPQASISRIERGIKSPTLRTLEKLKQAGVPIIITIHNE